MKTKNKKTNRICFVSFVYSHFFLAAVMFCLIAKNFCVCNCKRETFGFGSIHLHNALFFLHSNVQLSVVFSSLEYVESIVIFIMFTSILKLVYIPILNIVFAPIFTIASWRRKIQKSKMRRCFVSMNVKFLETLNQENRLILEIYLALSRFIMVYLQKLSAITVPLHV